MTSPTSKTTGPGKTSAGGTKEYEKEVDTVRQQEGTQEAVARNLQSMEHPPAEVEEPLAMDSGKHWQEIETPNKLETASEAEEVGTSQKLQQAPGKATEGSGTEGEVLDIDVTAKDTMNVEESTMAVEETEVAMDTQDGRRQNGKPTNRVISYYKWRMKHHQWLNVPMRQALGKKEAPKPPHILNLQYPVWTEPEQTGNLEPRRKYNVRYEMRLVVAEATNLVEDYRQAVIKWFTKILKIDSEVVIYPWMVADWQADTTTIEDPDKLPTLFSGLKKYTPKAWL